ncbi:probable 4-coumarate--CoA ligase 1 [Aedes aegypti]|uniref:AMP-dependent synthetase/ligase domain-containing protein n=1 Tax=Aedes aegypti TaxID=7159 RepID=A0A1S4F3B9_AEDAE|nr:probable 4-coumarate--CoA ligase 1 [Aedes aegypti]
MSSSYDPASKVWSGAKLPGPFNPQANLGHLILNVLERNPSMVAQVSVESGVELTCQELRLRSIRAAQNLTKLGYKKGDMVGFAVRNRENVAPLLYGCFLIGAPVNCLDPDFTVDDMAHMLRISKPVLFLADEDNVETVKTACRDAEIRPKFVILDGRDCQPDDLSSSDLLQQTGSEQFYFPPYLGDSEKLIAAILCSSGTTGLPKGVSLSHAHIIHQSGLVCNIHLSKPPFAFSSLYWASGFYQLIQCPLNNATHYISIRRFSPEVLFDIVQKYSLTHVFCPPAQMAMVLQSPLLPQADLSSLRSFFSGGGFVSTTLRKSFEKLLPNCKISVGYGTSEIGYAASDGFGFAREGSVGMLAPNIEAKVLNDDDSQVGVNEKGVLWFRYPIKPLGYLYNQEATDEIMTDDGWVCSGDIGYFDKDSFLFLVDRKKEIIKYKNYQISPAEIEAVIEQLPEVAHVCVVGLFRSDAACRFTHCRSPTSDEIAP